MKKIFFVLVLLAIVASLFNFTPALADGSKGCENGQGNKPDCEEATTSEGGEGQDPVGGNAGPADPCTVPGAADCGNGDHGKGNPVNGSEHANCRAAQGEVDPICLPPAVDPTGTPTPVITPVVTETPDVLVPPVSITPEPGDGGEETQTIEVNGEQVDFNLEPYKAPDGTKITGKPVVAECPQDCCCECQSLDWLKLPIWLIAIALIAIALAMLVKVAFRHPILTLIAIFVVIRLVG